MPNNEDEMTDLIAVEKMALVQTQADREFGWAPPG
jgi:hypothetical protein